MIDGMHRVQAMKELHEEDPENFPGVIPVCHVYDQERMPPEMRYFAADSANETNHSVVSSCFIDRLDGT